MLEESFKPTVMFFRLTNFLVTFQTMTNKILLDLINTREVTSLIDNIIVETEKEEEYDEVVKKVVKRLAENYLYIKSKNQHHSIYKQIDEQNA